MPLRKATQAVISPNICTTDTSQTITGNKIFSNANVTGSLIGNVTGSLIGNVTGNVTGSASLNVLKTGDTMTGGLIVPAGATGSQVPRVSEVVSKTGDTMTGGLVVSTNTSTNALRVTQIGTGNAILVEDNVSPDASPFVVKSDGKVGIGTLLPNNALDVVGDAYVAGTITTNTLIVQNLQVGTNANIPTFTARINGNLDITTISAITFSGPTITITKTSHGLIAGDTITFIGQISNNAVLNGAWVIDFSDPNTFTFTISSTPAGALSISVGTIFAARYKAFFDAVAGGPIKIAKDAVGSFTLQFPYTKNINFIALGNCCNSSSAGGLFQPFTYTTTSFSFKTYTFGTTTLANFTDINIVIY
jgi:hypothetical protein